MISLLIAQATQSAAHPPQPSMISMVMPILLIFAVFYFIAIRPKQKEQKEKQAMLGQMKKYDKIVTIGGIHGTVVEIRDTEVIVKVDDNTNTRMKFSRGAIQRVVNPEGEKGSSCPLSK